MKVVILAGGLGTRISEESDKKPKPMIEIGGRPLLWHVMNSYSKHGLTDFVICLGYKGHVIKDFFLNYHTYMSNMTIDVSTGSFEILDSQAEDWRVTLVDTGQETMTGGRLKRIANHLDEDTFCMTYGDGISDIDITKEIAFHRKHGKLATVAAVQPPGRFGVLNVTRGNHVTSFEEKPNDEIGWINGGFFVLEPEVMAYIDGDTTSWEREPLSNLAKDGQLRSYHHTGFWKACDTLRDKRDLELLFASGNMP